ncbi:MAG: FRG domain-containing protein [Candidatus Fimenecus sp.]
MSKLEKAKAENFKKGEISVSRRLRRRLEDALDVSFAVSQIQISSMEEFEAALLVPFTAQTPIFYRGERICSPKRRLVPTYLRTPELLEAQEGKIFTYITGQTLFEYYTAKPSFCSVYETLYGKPNIDRMYPMLAFAQHYLDISPFIDFSASLYVALSFALKGRQVFEDDIVIYTAFDIGDDDTTCDEEQVNRWLSDYSVGIVRTETPEEVRALFNEYQKQTGTSPAALLRNPKEMELLFNSVSPTAKLINIPTNDLMKYQQGVFLLLNNFCLMDAAYFTKTVRQSFVIKKFVISKDICPKLLKLLEDKAPQYRYHCLLDIAEAVKER